jgi:hypothetical protein
LCFALRRGELARLALAGARAPANELGEALSAAHSPLLEALQSQRLRATA